MIPIEVDLRSTRVYAGLAGAGAAVTALASPHTLAGDLLWAAAVVIACLGYGELFDRLVKRRSSPGMAVVVGLCCLLLVSVVVARLGFLTRTVQIGAIFAGNALALVSRPSAPDPQRTSGASALAFAVVTGGLLVMAASAQISAFVGDGTNHVLTIKRLFDTGKLAAIHHQTGAQLIGESYFSVVGGAQVARLFDAGVCPALLVYLLGSEVQGKDRESAVAIVALLSVSVVLETTALGAWSTPWSAMLLIVAAFFALRRALAGTRSDWPSVVLPVALIALRYEYAIVTLVLVLGLVVLPPRARLSRRDVAIALAGWWIVSVAVQRIVVVGATTGPAMVDAALQLAIIPLLWAVLRLLGLPWRSPAAVIGIAALAYEAGVKLEIIAQSLYSPGADTAVTSATLMVLLLLVGDALAGPPPASGKVRLVPAAVILSFWIFATLPSILIPTDPFEAFRQRVLGAIGAVGDRRGYERVEDDRVRALQELTPAGSRLGFWGQHAASLDFHRNRIRDLSWPIRSNRWRNGYLAPLTPQQLAVVDYIVVEDLSAGGEYNLDWGPWRISGTAGVEPSMDLIARVGSTRLYRVR